MTVSIRQRANGKVALRMRGGGLIAEQTFRSEADAHDALRDCRKVIEHFTVDGQPAVELLEAALPKWAYPLIPGWRAE